jgi:hypothetical protein
MISRRFWIAVKLADRPQWRIAAESGVNANTLSKLMSGSLRVKSGDERVVRVGRVLGLAPEECFEEKQQARPETD